jgi:hypothetical protein
MTRFSLFLTTTVLAISGCGDAASQGADTDSSANDSDVDAGPVVNCDETFGDIEGPLFDQTNNRFIAQVWDLEDPYDEGAFSGSLFDGPDLVFHKEAYRVGYCRLMTYDGNACDETCLDSQFCVNGECQTPPSSVSAGPLTLSTSNGIAETLNPDALNGYFRSFDFEEVSDLDWVSMEMPELNADVSLTACIPEPIVPESDFGEAFAARADGEDVTLRWKPSTQHARIYLHMTTCIGTHAGISPVEIECEGRDVGELTIAGSFLDAFASCDGCWALGECGGHRLVRSHTVETEIDTEGQAVQLRGVTESDFSYFPGRDLGGTL